MAQNLSKASTYEQTFRTRHRGSGRPAIGEPGGDDSTTLFPSKDRHPLLVRVAQRRAYAVVHYEQRERLAELYEQEMKVLTRRELEEVARDVGTPLDDSGKPRRVVQVRRGAGSADIATTSEGATDE